MSEPRFTGLAAEKHKSNRPVASLGVTRSVIPCLTRNPNEMPNQVRHDGAGKSLNPANQNSGEVAQLCDTFPNAFLVVAQLCNRFPRRFWTHCGFAIPSPTHFWWQRSFAIASLGVFGHIAALQSLLSVKLRKHYYIINIIINMNILKSR